MYESEKFKAHALQVLTTVSLAVSSLGDLPGLVPKLRALGLKHAGYGIEQAHYDVVGQALLDTLSLGLGDSFTPDTKAAWEGVWGMVAGTMQSVAAEAIAVASVPSTTNASAVDWYTTPDPALRCAPPSVVHRLKLEAASHASAYDWYLGTAA